MKNISIKGIILGTLTTLGIDIVFGIIIAIIFKSNINSNIPIEQAMNNLMLRTDILIYGLIVGTMSTILGGYIAARVAQKGVYLNSGFIGLIGIIIGIFSADTCPLWYNIIGFITVVPAALLGGHFARNYEY